MNLRLDFHTEKPVYYGLRYAFLIDFYIIGHTSLILYELIDYNIHDL